MKIQKLLGIMLGLSILMTSYAAYAAPSGSYKAAVIADCSKLRNCPLMRGDILWNDENSRSGLPLNNGMLFLGVNTHVKIIDLTRNLQDFSLIKGTLGLRVWETRPRQVYKIRTGNLRVSIRASGYYRVDVSPNGRETMVRVVEGRAEVRIGNLVQVIRKGETFRYANNRFLRYSKINMPSYDEHYYFSSNFINSYYSKYPVGAPPARFIPRYVNGPRIEIIYYHPITIYNQPFTIYNQPVIVRDPRYRRSEPAINIDINLNRAFGGRSERRDREDHRDSGSAPQSTPRSMPEAVIPTPIEQKQQSGTIIPKPKLESVPAPEMSTPEAAPKTAPFEYERGQKQKSDIAPPVPAPEVPALEMPAPEAPALKMPAPEVPALEMPTPEAPALEMPAPEAPAPEAPIPEVVPESITPSAPIEHQEAPKEEPEATIPEPKVESAPAPQAVPEMAPEPQATPENKRNKNNLQPESENDEN